MKTFRVGRCWIALLALAWAGCSSSPMSRIDANRAKYESWPLDVQEAVLNGEAKKGMTPDQVEMALGKPAKVIPRGGDEVWVYGESGSGGGGGALRNTGVSIGGGMGGVGLGTTMRRGGGGGRGSNSNDEKEVVFSNGVVIRAD